MPGVSALRSLAGRMWPGADLASGETRLLLQALVERRPVPGWSQLPGQGAQPAAHAGRDVTDLHR